MHRRRQVHRRGPYARNPAKQCGQKGGLGGIPRRAMGAQNLLPQASLDKVLSKSAWHSLQRRCLGAVVCQRQGGVILAKSLNVISIRMVLQKGPLRMLSSPFLLTRDFLGSPTKY